MDIIISQVDTVSFGDFHGNIESALANLETLKLIAKPNKYLLRYRRGNDLRLRYDFSNIEWTGGDRNLIILGDVLDRGLFDVEIYELIAALQEKAAAVSGHVEAILGNHELENIFGNHESAHPTLRNPERTKVMSPNGALGSYLCKLRVVIKIGDTIYSHAGNTLKYAKMGIEKINKIVRDAFDVLALEDPDQQISDEAKDLFSDVDENPLWTRRYNIHRYDKAVCEELEEVLKLLDARRMVIGHNPQFGSTIGSQCGGQLLLADIGLSRHAIGVVKVADGEAFEVRGPSGKEYKLPLGYNGWEDSAVGRFMMTAKYYANSIIS
eukprot:Partr_v1_DN24945_c2_g1_i1_m45137 putative Inherit from KOG: serine threonine-protein phosphatase